jgi:uncharacterized protein
VSDEAYERLAPRVGRLHLRQRLGIEREHVTQIFGRGRNFFHIENWYSIHSLIRLALRLTGLYRRGQRNAAAIELRRHELALAHLPPAFDGYTILQLSDLHLDMRPDITEALIAQVRELDYDLCVLTGDFRALTYGPFAATIEALSRLRTVLKDPVYAILGNHDFIEMVPEMEALDIRLLLNEATYIERGGDRLYLAGIDDPHYYRVDNLEKAATEIPLGAASVLLAHSPEIFRQAAHAGFDLMLCGHTHGGQICLPGGLAPYYNAKAPRRVCRGAWQHHTMRGYTSNGCGSSVVDVRYNCPPEVTLHTLRRA